MARIQQIFIGLVILTAIPLWSQVENNVLANRPPQETSTETSFDHPEDHMLTPPPVGGQTFPVVVTAQERANYLNYGVSFTTMYTDNAIGAVSGKPISDVSYSIAPVISLDESTSRAHWVATYAPGFTFYQKVTDRNEGDQNVSINLTYRLSPALTISAEDGFQKSSNVLSQTDFASGTVSGQTQVANFSVIAPIADRLSNFGNIGLAYQFELNDMVGANGTFTTLHYPNQAQVPGLFDSSSQAGSAFYSHRIGRVNYIGASYQYQRLIAYPTVGTSQTQTQAALCFYTFYPSSRFSLSFYGGPQHSDTIQPRLTSSSTQLSELRTWQPAAGASLNWQAKLTAFAVSYNHIVAGGSGLTGAVQMDVGSATIRQLITKTLSGSVAGGYAQNDLLSKSILGQSGHSIFGSASVQQMVGQHVYVQLGYTWLHQSYSNVAVISTTPNTNRGYVEISYQFSRPVGR